MGLLLRILMQVLLLVGVILIIPAAAAAQALDGCVDKCGNVQIPYPFGINQPNRNCSRDANFLITCDTDDTTGLRTPKTGDLSVKSILVEEGQLQVQLPISKVCYDQHSGKPLHNSTSDHWSFSLSNFTISNGTNTFVTVGCDSTTALLLGSRNNVSDFTGCFPTCDKVKLKTVEDGSCSGIGCCQVEVPKEFKDLTVSVSREDNQTDSWGLGFIPCSYAFLVEKGKFNFSPDYLHNLPYEDFPVMLDWSIRNETCEEARNKTKNYACRYNNTECHDKLDPMGYHCKCKQGYEGNPYHPDGCKDTNECAYPNLNMCIESKSCVNTEGNYTCSCPRRTHGDGKIGGEGCIPLLPHANPLAKNKVAIGVATGFIALIIGSFCLYSVLQQRKFSELKKKFFRQNGGLILQQQSIKTTKIFSAEELKKATYNYDESRIIGQGGFGTVYKGFLPDNTIVAIKKSKTVDQSQIEQFINEVIVLSHVIHRNVVKLLGCCLETEVPLLVYEFISNGTLFDYIHHESLESTIPWETRLRIAAETAEALSYLHSAVSTPIIHRDVKPMNILLDDKFTAKVSDFGASRLVPLDQTQLGTMVQGTVGYLDPEYLLTSQLTEKSDVYSFGVVLVELLTGKKAFSVDRSGKERSLAMHFLTSLKDDKLFEVLEHYLVDEGNKEQLQEVAQLAKRCLKVKGEERPIMKEVAMELEGLRRMSKHPWVNAEVKLEETEYLLGETSDSYKYRGNSNKNTVQDSMRDHIILPLELDGGR